MRLLSVNIGARSTQSKGKEQEITGIYKVPTTGPVQVSLLGIPGDFIGDTTNHGGRDQAVYLYGDLDYAWWSKELGKPLSPGTFGENLTIEGLESTNFSVGDRLQIGSTTLEITAPRTPCSTLARRMGDPMFVKKYRRAERPGLYCRVVRVGTVQAGDEVLVEQLSGERVTVLEIFREHYALVKDEDSLRRILAAPIAIRARASVEKHLRQLLDGS